MRSLLSGTAALLWCAVLLVPRRPWRNGQALEAIPPDCSDHIPATLNGLAAQGGGLLVGDRSGDDTAQVARGVIEQTGNHPWQVVEGQSLEAGWSGACSLNRAGLPP